MMKLCFKLFIMACIVFICLSNLNYCVLGLSEDQATLTLNEAEELIASTFEIVRTAEINGADISGLSELLTDATQLLAQAKNSFRLGDFDKTEKFANLVLDIGNEVKNTALSLRDIKSDLPTKNLWDTVTESIITIVLITTLLLLTWNFFKRLYYNRKKMMKPKVIPIDH